jgi:hypothetical protein
MVGRPPNDADTCHRRFFLQVLLNTTCTNGPLAPTSMPLWSIDGEIE